MKRIFSVLMALVLVSLFGISLAKAQGQDSLIVVCNNPYPEISTVHVPVYARVNEKADQGMTSVSVMFYFDNTGLDVTWIEWNGTSIGEAPTAIETYIGAPVSWAMVNVCGTGDCRGGTSAFTFMESPNIPSGYHILFWLVVDAGQEGNYLLEPRDGIGNPPLNNEFGYFATSSYPTLVGCDVETRPVAFFMGNFKTPEGEPCPFDVVISDGEWVQEFDSVTTIETAVPPSATYTYVYEAPDGHAVMNQIILRLQAGESSAFNFYALNPSELEVCVRPYLCIEEVGADTIVSWDYDPSGDSLRVDVGTTNGKFTDFMVKMENARVLADLDRRPWYFDWHTMSLTQPFGYMIDDGNKLPPFEISTRIYDYEQIEAGKEVLGFRHATYNMAIVDTFMFQFHSTLRGIEGTPHEMEYLFPQYAVSPGNYLLTPEGLPEEYGQLELPATISTGKPQIIDLYPPKVTELEPFTFGVAGEYFFAYSSFSHLFNVQKGDSIMVDVSTEIDRDWWGYFVLPDSLTVGNVYAHPDTGGVVILNELYDYTINSVDSYNLVAVRIEPHYARLILTQTPVDIKETLFDHLPKTYSLSQNYPNPFNPMTQIKYALPKNSQVKLEVYNLLGQKVTSLVDEPQKAGHKSVRWDPRSQTGNEVSSGLYFYRLQAGDFVETRKMILLR